MILTNTKEFEPVELDLVFVSSNIRKHVLGKEYSVRVQIIYFLIIVSKNTCMVILRPHSS